MTRDELLKTEDAQQGLIATFLAKYAEDNQWTKIEDSQKDIAKCYDYIVGCARKLAKGGKSVMVDDKTVFNWAIEFYEDEQEGHKATKSDEIKIEPSVYEEVKLNAERRESAKKAKKKSTEEQYEEQMFSLFDL